MERDAHRGVSMGRVGMVSSDVFRWRTLISIWQATESLTLVVFMYSPKAQRAEIELEAMSF